jgi:hypothetical protein
MILSIPGMLPRADRVHVVRDNETETYRSDYTERTAGVPQLLLVEQFVPGSAILPHFHAIDQFQVFIDGDGKLGHHAIEPISIHYSNGHTGYGPIVAGERGLSYYVLRPGFDVMGSQYLHLPEARKSLKPGGKRYFLAEGIKARPQAELRKLAAPEVRRVIGVKPGDPDAGIFAEILSMGPHAPYTGSDPRKGGGQVYLVLAGSLTHEGQTLSQRAAIAVTHDERPVTFASGADGVQAMVLQYPRRSQPA